MNIYIRERGRERNKGKEGHDGRKRERGRRRESQRITDESRQAEAVADRNGKIGKNMSVRQIETDK